MAGPWEKYGSSDAAPASGPWQKYAQPSGPDAMDGKMLPFYGMEGDPNLSGTDLAEMAKGVVPFSGSIFAPPKDQRAEGYRSLGGDIRDLGLTLAPVPIPGVGAVARGVGEIGSRLMPGAAEKAAQGVAKAGEAVSEVGPLSDVETLGAKIKADLTPRVQAKMSDMDKAAPETRKLYAEYLSQPPEVAQDILKTARDSVLQLRSTMKTITPGQSKIMNDAVTDLARDPSMANIETTRKDLMAIAKYGRPQEKIMSAADRQFAQKLSTTLENAVRSKVPSGAKYIDQLHAASELKDFGAMEIDPTKTFTKGGLTQLRRLAGGDEKLVSDAAGEFTAAQLKDKSAKEARDWATKNADWLSDVPKVRADVEKYVKGLEDATLTQQKVLATQAKAMKTAKAAGYVGIGDYVLHSLRGIIP